MSFAASGRGMALHKGCYTWWDSGCRYDRLLYTDILYISLQQKTIFTGDGRICHGLYPGSEKTDQRFGTALWFAG